MDYNSQQLAIIVNAKLLGVALDGVERDHHVAADAVAVAVVKGDYVGIVVVLEKLPVGSKDVLVVTEYLGQGTHVLVVIAGNSLYPFLHLIDVDGRHLNILGHAVNFHNYHFKKAKCKGSKKFSVSSNQLSVFYSPFFD